MVIGNTFMPIRAMLQANAKAQTGTAYAQKRSLIEFRLLKLDMLLRKGKRAPDVELNAAIVLSGS
ncbi:MAG TPA: hypothetical protein PKE16_17875 [Hyphomicrobium sp.]|nr:hypothetical protein [Hyphomicrobium sp.]